MIRRSVNRNVQNDKTEVINTLLAWKCNKPLEYDVQIFIFFSTFSYIYVRECGLFCQFLFFNTYILENFT